jgi:hypothetical protein
MTGIWLRNVVIALVRLFGSLRVVTDNLCSVPRETVDVKGY